MCEGGFEIDLVGGAEDRHSIASYPLTLKVFRDGLGMVATCGW